MYAIVEIAGLQYKVEQDQTLFVNRLQGETGDQVSFEKVLLTDNGTVTVGAPVISGVTVVAKILDQVKADKVIVFKKKRRKGYKVKRGHRQQMTQIQIVSIGAGSGTAKVTKSPAKKTEDKKVEAKTATTAKATTPKADAKTAVKASTEKKPATTKKATAKADDLEIVEGIGPKAAAALIAAGIDTFAKLSKAKVEKVNEILDGGENLAHLDPTTWGKQAALADAGKWDELKTWQDELMGGRED